MLVNLERTRNVMEQYGLNILIATHPHNVFYLSEFPLHPVYEGPPCLCLWNIPVHVILPLEKNIEPTIILPIIQLDYYYACSSWIKDFRCYGEFYVFKAEDADPAKLTPLERNLFNSYPPQLETISDKPATIIEILINVIDEKGLSKGRLGLDERGLTVDMFERIKHELSDATILKASNHFFEIKMVKTSEEISRMRKAAEININGIKAIIESISPGVTEKELSKIYWRTVMEEVGLDEFYPGYNIIGGGGRSAFVLVPGWRYSEQPLKRGDFIRVDCEGLYRNYWTDIGRTMVIGQPKEKLKKYYAACRAGHEEAINTIAPREKASKIFYVAIEKIKKTIPHYRRPHIGHGIGIECYNPLLHLSPYCDLELQENMVVNLETPYFEIGTGGLNIEETILVTKKGCEDLSHGLSRELYVA